MNDKKLSIAAYCLRACGFQVSEKEAELFYQLFKLVEAKGGKTTVGEISNVCYDVERKHAARPSDEAKVLV